jgi:hypothetical protein
MRLNLKKIGRNGDFDGCAVKKDGRPTIAIAGGSFYIAF